MLKLKQKFKAASRRVVLWWNESVYADAGVELVMVFILSNLPLIFLVLQHFISHQEAQLGFGAIVSVLEKNWKPGEILVFVAALLAPFCYVMYQYHRARRHLPGYWFFLLALLLLYPVAAWLFAHEKLGAIKNEDLARRSSLVLYCIALFIWYLGLAFQRRLNKPPTDEGDRRAEAIAAELRRRAAEDNE